MESKLLVFWAGMPNGRLCGRCAVLRRFVLQQPPETRQPHQQQQEQQHGEPEGRSVLLSPSQRDSDDNDGGDDDKSTHSRYGQKYRLLLEWGLRIKRSLRVKIPRVRHRLLSPDV